jgi:lysozyme
MAEDKKISFTTAGAASLVALAVGAITPQIQNFEGTRFTAYRDIGGVLTVCSGHTGTDVVVSKVYSSKDCSNLTEQDAEKASAGVLAVSPHLRYHPMQLAAAISFSYNVGIGEYSRSSVASNFNSGNFSAGCASLMKYVYAGGRYSDGIANRRKQEYAICISTLTPKGLTNVGITS